MGNDVGGVSADFGARAERLDDEIAALETRSQRYSAARFALFVAAALSLLLGLDGAPLPWRPYLVSTGIALLGIFGWLVVRHLRLRTVLERRRWRLRINREHEARLRRDWGALEEVPLPEPPAGGPPAFATDLDLWGHASLMRLAAPCYTAPGRAALREAFLSTPDPVELRARQEAVGELSGLPDVTDEVAARAATSEAIDERAVEAFLSWAEGGGVTLRGGALRTLVPLLNVGMTVALFLFDLSWLWLVPGIAAGSVLLAVNREGVRNAFEGAASGERGVAPYGAVLEPIEALDLESGWARDRIGAALHPEGVPASEALDRLSRLLVLSELRLSMLHLPLNLLLLWDLQVVDRIERWRRAHGEGARRWMTALGRFEAIAAAAFIRRAHPNWAFPEVTGGVEGIAARALGHPLIPPIRCIRNDATIPPPGRFLLVTGSNMAGKSTLLRAVGTNALLARIGAPVCATRMVLPPVRIETAMRIRDDLEAGLSTFMAELERLREVVEVARNDADPERPLLFLLDEILQGTNSAERRVAARTILRHLLETPAIGAVTTHDLSLADAPDLRARAVEVHFREEVVSREEGMRFDYRLRSGVAPTTNALKLLEVLGLTRGDEAVELESSDDAG